MDDAVLTVAALTERLKTGIEKIFPFVWVKGEVTNISRPVGGHIYFSLRDGDALLNCVWFKSRRKAEETFDPLTGEVYEDGPRPSPALTMVDGDTVICAGPITVYPARGRYQLLVETVQDTGQGNLLRRLEALKQTLAARGWFDPARKRSIPRHPGRVALITAPTGAAVHDFITIASTRGLGAEIHIFPVPVQGSEAAAAIAKAVERINNEAWADTVVIIRGGGSLEDLWAFNEECLAQAVVNSRIPVVSGVGHEVDISICDLVADVRAATPSHAAQLLWQERRFYAQLLDDCTIAVDKAIIRRLNAETTRVGHIEHALSLLSPSRRVALDESHFLSVSRRLESASAFLLKQIQHRTDSLAARLNAVNPHAPLARGYAMLLNKDGLIIRSVEHCTANDRVTVRLHDGSIDANITAICKTDSQTKPCK